MVRRFALTLFLFAAIANAQPSTKPLTLGLANTLFAKTAGGSTIAGTTTFANIIVTSTCTGCSSGSVPTTRLISTTSPLGGGGDLSADRTLTCTTCATSANALSFFAASSLLAAPFGSQGTTTTVLHGNAGGVFSFGSVVSADLNITTSTCTNQFLSAISATAAGTCTTDTLASAQHANQGTTTTVLHGNGAGNPSFGAVVDGDLSLTAPALGAPTATTVQSSGNVGLGVAPSGTSGLRLIVKQDGNQGTKTQTINSDAASAGAFAATTSQADVAIAQISAFGSGFPGTFFGINLAGQTSFNNGSSGTVGVTFGSSNAAPVVIGTNATRAITISASTQAVSMRGTQTNDSATAGDVGELISGTVAANTTSLSTGTPVNVGAGTNITLTAGEWDCTGAVNFTYGATTSITNLAGGVSTTTGTLPAQDLYFDHETAANVPTATAVATYPVPTVPLKLASSTSVFLVTQATFTVSTVKVGGTIRCRRMR